ncbi:hypothetical protein Ga0100231_015495 [Opitutaceae bacterium TAV4]|nr:hypothetical protein Ga0100231_015495 [Opitutaceae bacterium TAV4]RRJ99663.1 hypothetical protein Ga0100230_016325 [Opitutaceae bacterium TAV3]
MKTALWISLIICTVLAAYVFLQHAGRRGDTATLDAIRAIRHGASKAEVRKIMGRDPQIMPAQSLPKWMREVVPEKEKGEYWFYFMGYPPRNLIIYIDEYSEVVFTTWQHT